MIFEGTPSIERAQQTKHCMICNEQERYFGETQLVILHEKEEPSHEEHVAHAVCAAQWFLRSPTCPYCRKEIVDLKEDEEDFQVHFRGFVSHISF